MKNKFLKLHDIKQLTKVSGSKVYKLVESNQFPKPIKIGKRSVRWIREEVNEWVKGKTEIDKEQTMRFDENHTKPVEVTKEAADKIHEMHDKARQKSSEESEVHLGDFIEDILDRTIHVYKQSNGYTYPFVELYPKQMAVCVRYMDLKIDYAPGDFAVVEGPKGTRFTISEKFDMQHIVIGLAAALNSWKMLEIMEKEKKVKQCTK